MRLRLVGLILSLAIGAWAEDVLLVDDGKETFGPLFEELEIKNVLNLTVKIVSSDVFRTMTTPEFASFAGIVIPEPRAFDGQFAPFGIQFLAEIKEIWGPAITGNIVVIGTDLVYPNVALNSEARQLFDNAIRYSVAGRSDSGAIQTGLYLSLSRYYAYTAPTNVDALSYFGDFDVRGRLGDTIEDACFYAAHIVAASSVLDGLDDTDLSSFFCPVREVFSSYPSTGENPFQALAVAKNINFPAPDGDIVGRPYILTRDAVHCQVGMPIGNGTCVARPDPECKTTTTITFTSCTTTPTQKPHCTKERCHPHPTYPTKPIEPPSILENINKDATTAAATAAPARTTTITPNIIDHNGQMEGASEATTRPSFAQFTGDATRSTNLMLVVAVIAVAFSAIALAV